MFPFRCGPPEGLYEISGIEFVCARRHKTSEPTLVGHFFNSYAFQSALTGFSPDIVVEIVDTILRLLFQHLLAPIMQIDDKVLVMNFRGGDIFNGYPPPEWYLQPPASYYLSSALFARDRLGLDQVTIVAEDRTNPALEVAESTLLTNGFRLAFQSSSIENDVALMLNARHLVSPFGTLCEALAMLSNHLRTYFAFRQFESHRHLHARRPALLTHVLKAHEVRPVRIIDRMGDYIAPLSWQRTAEQIQMMQEFPRERLAIQDLTLEPDETDDCFVGFPTSAVMLPAAEAYYLRRTVITLRTDLARQAADWREEVAALQNSFSWRVTAPLRRVRRGLLRLLRAIF